MKKIINEYYCDRCGKRIPYEPRKNTVCRSNNEECDLIILQAELCDGCDSAFKGWWEDDSYSDRRIKEQDSP